MLLCGDRILAIEPGDQPATVPKELTTILPNSRQIVVEEFNYPGCALLPGLINAHTHLELSGWSKELPAGQKLWEWIPEVVAFRRSENYRPAEAFKEGLAECVAGGACGVVDISLPNWAMWWPQDVVLSEKTSPPSGTGRPRVLSFLECIAAKDTENFGAFWGPRLEAHRWACAIFGLETGISPHAPYTVPLDVLRQLVTYARQWRLPVAMHLAETPEEEEFLRHPTGPFQRMLSDFGIDARRLWRTSSSWAEYLLVLAQAPRALIVHGNYLSSSEQALLRHVRKRVAVVFCPRTHCRFRHARYPVENYLSAGIPVILGTDSRASNPDLSILRELQTVRQLFPRIPGPRILAMATTEAARALGWHTWGRLEPGASAQITVVDLGDRADDSDPIEAVLDPQATVRAVWINGQLAYSGNT